MNSTIVTVESLLFEAHDCLSTGNLRTEEFIVLGQCGTRKYYIFTPE